MFCMRVHVLSRAKTCQTAWHAHLFVRQNSEKMFPSNMLQAYIVVGGDMLSVCLHFFLHDTSCQPPAVHCVWVATCLFISIHVLQLSVWYLWVFWATRLPFRLNKSCAYIYIYIVKVFNCFISDAGMVFNLDHSMVRCLLPVLHLIISGSL